jgi:hypothetical protein
VLCDHEELVYDQELVLCDHEELVYDQELVQPPKNLILANHGERRGSAVSRCGISIVRVV